MLIFPRIGRLFVFAALATLSLRADGVKHHERVLMLSEMGTSAPPVSVATQEILKVLRGGKYSQLEFYFESLDTNLFPDEANQAQIEDWLRRKYANRKPDVIIAAGPTPLHFLATSHTFFPDVPVVFVGSFKEQSRSLELTSRFTGTWLRYFPARTLDVAVQLKPDTRNVFVVGGVSAIDRLVEKIDRDELRGYEQHYAITYLTNLDMPEILDRVHRLPDHSIVLFSLLFKDAAGQHFISQAQALPLVVQASNAPVFQLVDVGMGSGAVGGYVSSFAGQGHTAAEDVLKVLDGILPDQIPQVDGTSQFMFDWRAVQRWRLDTKKIPASSAILFREPTLWERYRPQVIATAITILALSILSIYLWSEILRRKRAELEIGERLRFEQIISELSAHFIGLPADQIDAGVIQALDRLVHALNIDRLTVFKFTVEAERLVPMYISTISAHGGPPADIVAEGCEWYVSKLLARESVVINRLADIPNDADGLRLALEKYNVKSTVAVPIDFDGHVFGCLSFVLADRERVWSGGLITQFEMLGQVFANALARKEVDEERQELSGLLINAQEVERTRLARELHDDFSQRIAVLAVDLERTSKNASDISTSSKKRLHDLWNMVIGIGADLHSLSHRLHSSTLDSLGLVDGLDLLCEEFSEQSDLQTSFAHEQVPEFIPSEIALCLFRIVQEALRNVKKHGQASAVEVRLIAIQGGLNLSIVDNGVGFELRESSKRVGLGLRSMEERLRLVSGHLNIRSVSGKGVTIEAWVPITSGIDSVPTAFESSAESRAAR